VDAPSIGAWKDSKRIAPACDQQCGTSLDERTFGCIDRCHIEADRTSRP
jgi:hypothetical protein